MSQRLSTTFVNTNVPGTYVNYSVLTQPVGVTSSGIAVIMGEADGGPSFSQTTLAASLYTPSQLQQMTQVYTSGQLVDGFTALCSPSNDANITGTATQIYVVKTNTGTTATATLPSYGDLSYLNYGILGNQTQYQVLSTAAEVAPTVTGTTIPAFGAPLNGASFTIRLNGGVSHIITLSATPSLHNSISTLVTELNTLLVAVTAAPTGITASPGTPLNTLTLTVGADSNAYSEGWGKSFELIDSTPGDLAALGLSPGLTISSQEAEIEQQNSNSTTGTSETLAVNSQIALLVGYQGTSATITITNVALTTAVVGGAGIGLSLTLSEYSTIGLLASFINSQPGYTAAALPAASSQPATSLDAVSAQGICSTESELTPGRIKIALANYEQAMTTSRLLAFSPTASAGLPAPTSAPAYLAGGSRGPTLAIDIVDALTLLQSVNCNIIVPLFSQNASADIAAGQTDPNSTYTIAAIDALLKSHCLEMSNPSLNRNRICILSNLGTFAAAAATAQTLASDRCSLTFQQVTQVNSTGVVTTFQPWYAACVAMGMQLGGFYKAIVGKYANVISIIDPSDYNNGNPGDTSEALTAGLLPLYEDVGGPKWVSDQTTYSVDDNFVYNSIQAMYDADLIAIDLKSSFTDAFVGQSLADVSAASASAFLTQKMASYMQLKLIAPSNGAPLGFNNAKVSINAPTMTIAVNIYLATAIYFIPISFTISAVQQSA